MSDATTFYRTMISQIGQLITILDQLETISDRMKEDTGLDDAAAAAAATGGRNDLTAQDFTNAAGALDQILFAFNSGSPTQKSFLYKML